MQFQKLQQDICQIWQANSKIYMLELRITREEDESIFSVDDKTL